jgi:hypothetical protein
VIPEFLIEIDSQKPPYQGAEIVPQLPESTATPMALLLFGNISSETKTNSSQCSAFSLSIAGEN